MVPSEIEPHALAFTDVPSRWLVMWKPCAEKLLLDTFLTGEPFAVHDRLTHNVAGLLLMSVTGIAPESDAELSLELICSAVEGIWPTYNVTTLPFGLVEKSIWSAMTKVYEVWFPPIALPAFTYTSV